MIKFTKPVDDIVEQMKDMFMPGYTKRLKSEDPFRAELYSNAQMKEHGAWVAKSHQVIKGKQADKVLKRLDDNEEAILDVHNSLIESVKEKMPVAPASEWFLDNFYLIKEQIILAKKHLPKQYSQTLPILAKGKSAGLPRVYDIALEIIAHNDGRVDVANVTTFINAYQTITKLTLGELWAIPIMLRLGIIENIRRIASRIAVDNGDKNVAIYWSNQFLQTAQKKASDVIVVLAEMSKSHIDLTSAFVAEFTRRLQGKGQNLAMPLTLLEQTLSETGTTSEELINLENQKQATDQVSIRNSIESIRLIKNTDWRDFVENVSVVQKILLGDIDGVYGKMDFNTRDRYRHVVEWASKKSGKPEYEIAQIAIDLAKDASEKKQPARQHHVGYFLIDDEGKQKLVKNAGFDFSFRDNLKAVLKFNRILSYAGSVLFFTYIVSIIAGFIVWDNGSPFWLALVVTVLSFVAFSQLFTVLTNWLSTIIISPKPLPKMNYSEGIPPEDSTLVAVPCMLTSISGIEELVEDLEIRYLSNIEDNLYFALLTDFADAGEERMPDDDRLLNYGKDLIEGLNIKYISDGADKFFLFHRPRKWNPQEKIWMAHERKRGKLGELNSLLRNAGYDDFSLVVGNADAIKHVKYVITLDADTHLPRESAWKMIATMAHPLNKPVVDEKKNRVVEGYGLLQPRTAVSLPKSNSSFYTKMHANDSGLDPYTQLVSDVYQDLFGEGSFVGKGIYDIDVFEKVLGETFPENRILSHDLLEGSYVRAGLLTDVQLFEDYVPTYWADVARRHRWIRGDWQIASWGLPWVPGKNKKLIKNYLSGLSRWKIFDNLRRSLVPASVVLLFIIGWLFLPQPLLWTVAILAIWFLTPVLGAIWHTFHKSADIDMKSHINDVGAGFTLNLTHIFFNIAVLLFEAWANIDAILRANWRMLISRRRLLQWTPSSAMKSKKQKDIADSYAYMWVPPFVAIITAACILYFAPQNIFVAAPILILWLLSPSFAWWLSKPQGTKVVQLTKGKKDFLYLVSRKTWAYFEDFITAEQNWLPPDNYQLQPRESIANRTSPTNIGLAMLSGLSAYDFGYITPNLFIEKLQKTFATLNSLERFRGHFYNWYDTVSLVPLNPRYVSTVDSGNFVTSLLTLRQGLQELQDVKIFSDKYYLGLKDTVAAAKSSYDEPLHPLFKNIEKLNEGFIANRPESLYETINALNVLLSEANALKQNDGLQNNIDGISWLNKIESHLISMLADFDLLTPWHHHLPVSQSFSELKKLDAIPTFNEIYEYRKTILPVIEKYLKQANGNKDVTWLNNVLADVKLGSRNALEQLSTIEQLMNECAGFADVDYGFLYDKQKHLFHIGFNVTDDVKDKSYYDMLASEARLGIFTAIAQGKISQGSWFALGRLITNNGSAPVLLSWSGSMFEYLMPQLIMPVYENTLLERTSRAAVKNQISFAEKNGIPWGISESAYNLVDTSLNYQYQSFGVPGLGLKRGLGDEMVVAPYATMLAMMVNPVEAADNLMSMAKKGFEGRYGFYEAIDYTPARMPRGESHVLIKSFMVHHQAMGFLAMAYFLLGQKMQRRFEKDPQFQSALLLLQERAPRATNFYSHTEDPNNERQAIGHDPYMRIINTPNTYIPEIQLLSNGKYQVAISNAGAGYSRWKNLSLVRWREDATQDNWGMFCYIKDLSTGNFWSNTYQPTLQKAKVYESIFSQGHVEFKRIDEGFETKTDIVVSPEEDVEIRRIKISNKSTSTKTIEVTSYAEVVLAAQAADEAHPAFSNLFVQTDIKKDESAILCTRRARNRDEDPPWMFHMLTLNGAVKDEISFETDRMKFIGRTKSIQAPAAIINGGLLSGSSGSVLDPIVSIRYKITLKPKQTATFDMVMGAGESKEVCENLISKYQDRHIKNRAFELSWTHSQVLLRQINANEADAQLYNSIAGSVLYSNDLHRADAAIIKSNIKGQPGLWSYAISGDLPIVLARVNDSDNIEFVKQLIRAHSYWRLKGLQVDLVIWNEDYGSYRQVFHDQILGFISATSGAAIDQPGGIFVRWGDQISNEDRILFQTVARLIFNDTEGSLTEQMSKRKSPRQLPPSLKIATTQYEPDVKQKVTIPQHIIFNNGTGGFTQDGKEYVIFTDRDKTTPAPWVNIIANAGFGTMVSETGSAYTWADNAHSFRITPWKNDPVTDKSGEAVYIRDEHSGRYWSASPLPKASNMPYLTRHGFGYSVYEHINDGIWSQMWVYVDAEDPVKYLVLKMRNISGRERKLSATGFVEWVLGDMQHKTKMYVVSEVDHETGVLFAKNRYDSVFSDKVAFFDTDSPEKTFTCDRMEFLGRNGTMQNPEAMLREKLSGKTGAALDPCTAIQVTIELHDEEEKEVIFRLGVGKNEYHARELVRKLKGSEVAHEAQTKVHDMWNRILGSVYVKTPDEAMNVMTNGWWVYQALACRLWGRSGFYQSGGAFGFRDQLQDVLALMHTTPEVTRDQILLAASRQFKEGDVQHWWHPPSGRGVRTTCSDDYLWLPFVTARYIETTGDTKILDEYISFIEGRQLRPDEESYYDLPVFLDHWETLYNHCKAAIRFGLKFGVHGLPLIGSGDWNDGMDKVGEHGKGESVWLGFFLYDVLERFNAISQKYGDTEFAMQCKNEAEKLKENINKNAWDGEWYRRAYFDDGTPLGSKQNEECSIDSISQSWSVLSGAGTPERTVKAMASLNKYLVDRENGLIKLLTPAFDKSDLYPGYIKGYVPGVRENGGQYTHAAVWAMMAFAAMKDSKTVWELFSMTNPVNHSLNDEDVQKYKVEPYVMAADVYGVAPHQGRGGWTWYTGSAGWTYQLALGSILGVKRDGDKLYINPCIPEEWDGFELNYRVGENSFYYFTVNNKNKNGNISFSVDGEATGVDFVELVDDGKTHQVLVEM